jgi:hypothetical protein
MRASFQKEINDLNNWSRQVKESLSEQERVLQHQKDQIEKVKLAISKLYSEKQELLQRIELSYHSAKLGREVDGNYSKDVSLNHKLGSVDKNLEDKEPLSSRKASAKSHSQSQHQFKQEEEDKYITIHFNSKEDQKKPALGQELADEEKLVTHQQLMNQVKNYEMDADSKKFLEEYLKDDRKANTNNTQKVSNHSEKLKPDSNIASKESLGKIVPEKHAPEENIKETPVEDPSNPLKKEPKPS